MEQKITKWFIAKGKTPSETCIKNFVIHANMVYEANEVFNLTGYRTLDEIIDNLELGSIEPFLNADVLRGTRIADCGSGAGYPGIPFAIYFEGTDVVLFDSSEKKCDFLETVAGVLGLSSVKVLSGRIEELSMYRESFDLVLSRAMSQYYVSIEICAPLLRTGGMLYLFSRENAEDLPSGVIDHSRDMGLEIMSCEEIKQVGITGSGIIFKKTSMTPGRFPRRYPVIKREAKKFET